MRRRVIWKWPLSVAPHELTATMPVGAEILHLANDARTGMPAMWARVDPSAEPYETRRFRWAGTGDLLELVDAGTYIGTIHERGFVWHLFELGESTGTIQPTSGEG